MRERLLKRKKYIYFPDLLNVGTVAEVCHGSIIIMIMESILTLYVLRM